MTEKRNKKTTKVRMLSLSEGTNLPSQAEEEENQPLITHFSARFHSKTRRLFSKTRREIFQIRRLLLHFLPVSSSKLSKIGFNSRENHLSTSLFLQIFSFLLIYSVSKKGRFGAFCKILNVLFKYLLPSSQHMNLFSFLKLSQVYYS